MSEDSKIDDSKTSADFFGEFAEERALLHAIDVLQKRVEHSVEEKTRERIKQYKEEKNAEALLKLAQSMPECITRYFTFDAYRQIKS